METQNITLREAAGAIINEDGINALTIDTLISRTELSRHEILLHLSNDEDILEFMSLSLEKNFRIYLKAFMNCSIKNLTTCIFSFQMKRLKKTRLFRKS
jgi:hypothetical protein